MRILKGILLPAFCLGLWWTTAQFGLVNRYLLPGPGEIWQAAETLARSGELVRHAGTSLLRVMIGFFLTFLSAFPLAIWAGTNRRVIPYIEPLLEFVRHIPPIACIPILILWFGIGEPPKLAIVFLATFFPIFLNTLQGIIHCDARLIEVGQVFGLSMRDRLLRIILPSALPSIVTGMRLGMGYSWRSLIGAELIAASSGIGYMIMDAEQLSRPDVIIVGIMVIGIMGYIIDFAFFHATQRLVAWRPPEVDNGWN